MKKIILPGWAVPIIFLVVCLISYGLLIPWLGFYMDDWYLMWFSKMFGPLTFIRYYLQDRPFLSILYIATSAILGQSPLVWQIFAILARWAAVLAFWWTCKQIWPGKTRQATWAALIFAVYPGFKQQWMAVMYSNGLLLQALYLVSFGSLIYAIRNRRWFWPMAGLSLVSFVLSLFTSEYFFGWELLRPILLWIVFLQMGVPRAKRFGKALLSWAPYLAIWLGFWVWRTFFFVSEQHGLTVLRDFSSNPMGDVLNYLQLILNSVLNSAEGVWEQALHQPHTFDFNNKTTILYWLIVLAGAGLSWLFLSRLNGSSDEDTGQDGRWAWQAIGVGALALFFAGIPFWAAGLRVEPTYPMDRFTLAMMLGVALLAAGAIDLLIRTRGQQVVILSILVGLSIGMNFQTANTFRRESAVENEFIWQLAWRAPGLKPGTVLLTHEMPFKYFSETSLTAAIGWTYAPQSKTAEIPYFLMYTNNGMAKPLLERHPAGPVHVNLRVVTFDGRPENVLTFFYSPPGCLRMIDPEVDGPSPDWPQDFPPAIPITNLQQIDTAPAVPAAPPPELFGPEAAHGWCYSFEKADLARQRGDWGQVAALGSQLAEDHLEPAAPVEQLVFIEGFAHTGQWDQAHRLSREVADANPQLQPNLCRLWGRIARDTSPTPDQRATVDQLHGQMRCPPPPR